MQYLIVALVMWCVCSPAFAAPSDKERGREEQSRQGAGHVAHEVANAAMDEIEGKAPSHTASTPSRVPPGLAKKEHLPHGLEKQGKTPPGWNRGSKEGWDQQSKTGQPQAQEGLWARATRLLIRKSKEQPAQQPTTK